MQLVYKLLIISIVAGSILAGILKLVQVTLNNDAYILFFNMDYIPLLKHVDHIAGSGYLFHYIFCIVSVFVLFYLSKVFHIEAIILVYVIVYSIGSGVLYFLTGLTDKPPSVTSVESWVYWVAAHALFGIVVGIMIKYWVSGKK